MPLGCYLEITLLCEMTVGLRPQWRVTAMGEGK
jgi:hypothetical protein